MATSDRSTARSAPGRDPQPTPPRPEGTGLRVVGAGLGRTGTLSLKVALERLLGAPCHHMAEVRLHPDQLEGWERAVAGAPLDEWSSVFEGYAAAVDWPACRWYAELAEANPDALVLLSVRADADEWWDSASNTIFPRVASADGPWGRWVRKLIGDHLGDYLDQEAAKAGYERHNAEVIATIPADRLLVWRAVDGWEPICAALGVPVPDEPFPLVNSREQYRARRSGG